MPSKRLQSKLVKRVTVTSKRQISIPKSFADELNIQNEVIMELVGNKIIIKPVKDYSDDFSDEILSDLIDEGYTGEELKQEFKKRKSQLRPAIEAIVENALENARPTTIKELLGEEDNDQ